MKLVRRVLLTFLLLTYSYLIFAQHQLPEESAKIDFVSLLIPALLASIGYFGKSLYDIYTSNQKRKREQIENKLHFFYWPIYIRLKKNENTYEYLFEGKKDKDINSTDYIIAHYVEKNVLLKNHEEILDIITEYRYLADTDETIEKLINSYVRHVTIYKALLDAGINEYPGVAKDARYPSEIDAYFYSKTNGLQQMLEKMKF